MLKRLGLLAGAMLVAGGAAHAQGSDKTLIIYGSDPCPAGTICVRAPESERYRIPKGIRDNTPSASAEGETWSSRSKSLASVGRSGPGTCSNGGGGDWTGCWKQQMQAARDERAAAKSADPATTSDAITR